MAEANDERRPVMQDWELEFRLYLLGEIKAYDARETFRELFDPQWKGKAPRARFVDEPRDN